MLINFTFPVYNEESCLFENISVFISHLDKINLSNREIIIADNGSTDKTKQLSYQLTRLYPEITYINIDLKGRGLALRSAWTKSSADILSYMDIDLSTDLCHVSELINPIIQGHADCVTGTRFSKLSNVKRGLKRSILSHAYSRLAQFTLGCPIQDYQCGFKAISKPLTNAFLRQIKNDGWFFDTELLVRLHYNNYKLLEIPVNWVDDTNSKVNILSTIYEYSYELIRLRRDLNKLLNKQNHLCNF